MKKRIAAIIIMLSAIPAAAQPLVGISTGWVEDRTVVSNSYAFSVFRAGGIPCYTPLVRDSVSAALAVSKLDAFILTGGPDIDPSRFGQEIFNETVDVNSVRDTSDFLLLKAAVDRKIPILGICRGEQVINVFFGGTLYQDIPAQIQGNAGHSRKADGDTPYHKVRLEPGTTLRKIFGVRELETNSFHHQAVDRLGNGLTLNAVAGDGIVEGFEYGNILCVQFHPEMFVAGGDDSFLPIFRWLVDQALQ